MVVCPRCRRHGTVHLKKIRGSSGKVYEVPYIAHSDRDKGTRGGVRWCYLGWKRYRELQAKEKRRLDPN